MRALLTLVPFFVLVSVVRAQTVDVVIFGFGASSCGQFIAAGEGTKLNTHKQLRTGGMTMVSENWAYMQYAYGVLTETNMTRQLSSQIKTDNPAIELWLKNYCTKNPTDLFATAVIMFTNSVSR